MKHTNKISIGFVSLGCAKNLVDSEIMAARLTARGYALARAPERADMVIVNTCAFIRDAKQESIDAILNACSWKTKGRCRAVVAAGCLPQRYGHELSTSLPEIDAFIGVDEVGRIEDILDRLKAGERRIIEISAKPRAVIEPPPDRLTFTGAPFAYLKISDGCDHQCSFCAIPGIRGRYRSRSVKSIVTEAEALIGNGIRELNLISQDVTSYGCDLGSRTDLPHLLRALGKINGRFWIRLLYGHPGRVTTRLLETMGETSQVCRYLDLPIQHSDTTILRAMRRNETNGSLRRLFARIRKILPDMALRTTCLVGFPGETEKHFQGLLEFIQEIQFDHLGVFTFSREENTPAARLKKDIPRRQAAERRQRLMRAQQLIVKRKARERLGQTTEILVEKNTTANKSLWVGRSRGQAPEVDGVTYLSRPAFNLTPGMFVNARHTGSKGYDLLAEPCAAGSCASPEKIFSPSFDELIDCRR